MSDYLPSEIHAEIMKRLPVKSLMQFRSVSKTWKSLIDSSAFIADYSRQHTQPQHLLVKYADDPHTFEEKYVSYIDDDTFPEQKVSQTVHLSVEYHNIMGYSHGVLCLYDGHDEDSGRVVLWNVSIKKSVAVVVPNVAKSGSIYKTVLGFGVCCETSDPKIVKVTQMSRWSDIINIPRQVEVFTLSTGVWRSPYSNNLPRKSIQFRHYQEVVDGCLYWLATDRIVMGGGFRPYNLIISFDMASEEFREVKLPDSLARLSRYNLTMSKRRESLVLLERDVETANNPLFVVWVMEDGVPKSFSKVFTINTPHASIVSGFRKSGEPIIEVRELEEDERAQLVVYEPYSKHTDNLAIDGMYYFVYPYMDSLLLLNQPNGN